MSAGNGAGIQSQCTSCPFRCKDALAMHYHKLFEHGFTTKHECNTCKASFTNLEHIKVILSDLVCLLNASISLKSY